MPALGEQEAHDLCCSVLGDEDRPRLAEGKRLTLERHIEGVGDFTVGIYQTDASVWAVFQTRGSASAQSRPGAVPPATGPSGHEPPPGPLPLRTWVCSWCGMDSVTPLTCSWCRRERTTEPEPPVAGEAVFEMPGVDPRMPSSEGPGEAGAPVLACAGPPPRRGPGARPLPRDTDPDLGPLDP
jgi:hypothetical protein